MEKGFSREVVGYTPEIENKHWKRIFGYVEWSGKFVIQGPSIMLGGGVEKALMTGLMKNGGEKFHACFKATGSPHQSSSRGN